MLNVDINCLRTFVEVAKTRHFGRAADNLFVTQAAVSQRIRQLEDMLSVRLFKRERNNIQLTRQGEKLLGYAANILQTWQRATQEVCAPDDYHDLSLAAPKSIWHSKLNTLPNQLFARHPRLHLTINTLDSEAIIQRLNERSLDFAFLYEAPNLVEIESVHLFDIGFQMYSTRPNESTGSVSAERFVSVDLGLAFSRIVTTLLPQLHSAIFQANDWDMALDYLARYGGISLLPIELAKRAPFKLYPIKGGQPVRRDVYLCFNTRIISEEFKKEFIEELRSILADAN